MTLHYNKNALGAEQTVLITMGVSVKQLRHFCYTVLFGLAGRLGSQEKNPSNPKIPPKRSYYFSKLAILFQKNISLIRKSS